MPDKSLRESTKKYIETIYTNHKDADVEAWNYLIDVLLDFIEASIDEAVTKKLKEASEKDSKS
jgi:hypothetical protein